MTRVRGQSGASLVVVMAFIAFVSAIVPAVLGMSITGLRISGASTEDRNELYAAGSALEAAIAAGTAEPGMGSTPGKCSDTRVVIDALDVLVSCQGFPKAAERCGKGARVVGYLAQVRRYGSSDVLSSVAAEVVFQSGPEGSQSAVVTQWNPGAPKMPTPDDSTCDFDETTTTSTTVPATTTTTTGPTTTTTIAPTTTSLPPPTTTTTVRPTTTTTTVPPPTTTTAPLSQVTARWSDSSVAARGSRWRASGTAAILDERGVPVQGARVSVSVEYRDAAGTWRSDRSSSSNTRSDGTVGFDSRWYRKSGKKAVGEIRFTITEVADPSGRPWNPWVFPADVTLLAP